MRNLKDTILEKLKISKNKTREYTEHPTTTDELRKLVKDTLKLKVTNVV